MLTSFQPLHHTHPPPRPVLLPLTWTAPLKEVKESFTVSYISFIWFLILKLISCETGLCNWVQEVRDDFNWTLSSGLPVDQPWDGPQYDHTIENNEGVVLFLFLHSYRHTYCYTKGAQQQKFNEKLDLIINNFDTQPNFSGCSSCSL